MQAKIITKKDAKSSAGLSNKLSICVLCSLVMLPWHLLKLSSSSAGISGAHWSLLLTAQAELLHSDLRFLIILCFVYMEVVVLILLV